MTKSERWAYNLDMWRVWPRGLLLAVSYFCYYTGMWFMGLDKPSAEQSAFASLVSVAYAKVLDWYMANGVDWNKRRQSNAMADRSEQV